jgi:hypothetical protein
MRSFTADEIADINQRGRETVSRAENDALRHADAVARGERLRKDEAIRRGLVALWCEAKNWAEDTYPEQSDVQQQCRRGYVQGRTGLSYAELEALIAEYDYLRNVPAEAFDVRL